MARPRPHTLLRSIQLFGAAMGVLCLFAAVPVMAQTSVQNEFSGVASQTSLESGTHGAATSASGAPAGATLMPGNYRIGEGDVLNVSIFDTPEFSGIYAVSDKGEINFPLLGILKVSGLRANELALLLQQKLVEGNILRYPQVNVIVSSFISQGISIMGEVVHPGIYSTNGSQRLFDILSLASGLTSLAGDTAVIHHKGDRSAGETIVIREKDGQLSLADAPVQPGDTITVQRAPIVYVMGEVNKPGGFVMDRASFTVLTGIALAGGPSRTSSRDLYIIHPGAGGVAVHARVNLNKLVKGKTPDQVLQAGDIVFIPSSLTRSIVEVGVPSIISSTFGAAIYSALR